MARQFLYPTVLAWIGWALLPWHLNGSVVFPPGEAFFQTGLALALTTERWLSPLGLLMLPPLYLFLRPHDPNGKRILLLCGIGGLFWLAAQGYAIGLKGWAAPSLEALFGPLDRGQTGMGIGALLVALGFLFMATTGFAMSGAMKGDRFTTGAIGFVVVAIVLFVFMPVSAIIAQAFLPENAIPGYLAVLSRLTSRDIWSVACLTGAGHCGGAWNSLILSTLTGLLTTGLGLCFALVAVRTSFPAKKALRVLTVLPIITPPFVVGLAVILLFGRNGSVTHVLIDVFGLTATRYIYGLPGILLTQTLAFTPIAFLVLIGVLEGIAPSIEEAAQTLRAGRWKTFIAVTWPLMRPGLANAFLIGFIESLADFGNPLVMGGGYDVLSTKIFFAVVGAQNDPGRAAALSIILLVLCVSVFFIQRQWVGKTSYTTVSGKGFIGQPPELPRAMKALVYGLALPWAVFTLVLYALILCGGFVRNWGRDNSFSLSHYLTAFGLEWDKGQIIWTGRAWNSLFTTLEVAAISAPLTVAMGLLTAYLLVRQRFFGQSAFEFMTMLSFAIPGTVIGVSYILAFNTPPIELTGTASILVLCFVFRNMPVAIRAGIASMSQIDRNLDECALTLGASSFVAMRRIILPLLKPAIVASLVYAFVRSITSVSAVIFLVSARYDMATAYIVGRAEAGEYGVAIAYSSALILLMGLAIFIIQKVVGERRIGRRATVSVQDHSRVQS